MPHKLLLADDSLTIQKVVELVLTPENFEIKSVNDGEAGWETLSSFTPDIILADIDMPKMNGYQLCEKVKNDMAYAQIPVILLAGAFEPFDEEYAKSVYADDYIIKPFESQELISKVKALIVNKETAAQPPVGDVEEPQSDEIEAVSEGGHDTVSFTPTTPIEEETAIGTRWDDEVHPAVEEKPEDVQPSAEEGYEAESASDILSAIKGFDEELPEAMQTKKMVKPMPEGISEDALSAVIGSRIEEALNAAMPEISENIKAAAEKSVSEQSIAIIEAVSRELMTGLFESMRSDINAAINKAVPEIAEAIIKKEIEKITSEM